LDFVKNHGPKSKDLLSVFGKNSIVFVEHLWNVCSFTVLTLLEGGEVGTREKVIGATIHKAGS
jgi:hypothetical protein